MSSRADGEGSRSRMVKRHRYFFFFIFGFLSFLFLQLVLFLVVKGGVSVYKNEKISPLFLSLALLAFIIFSLYEIKKRGGHPLIVVSLGLVLGGGLSNLFDRIRIGGVADYLDLTFWQLNLADIFVIVGVLIFLYGLLKLSHVKDA